MQYYENLRDAQTFEKILINRSLIYKVFYLNNEISPLTKNFALSCTLNLDIRLAAQGDPNVGVVKLPVSCIRRRQGTLG